MVGATAEREKRRQFKVGREVRRVRTNDFGCELHDCRIENRFKSLAKDEKLRRTRGRTSVPKDWKRRRAGISFSSLISSFGRRGTYYGIPSDASQISRVMFGDTNLIKKDERSASSSCLFELRTTRRERREECEESLTVRPQASDRTLPPRTFGIELPSGSPMQLQKRQLKSSAAVRKEDERERETTPCTSDSTTHVEDLPSTTS